MATFYKILGQVLPVAETPTDLYTVPINRQSVCSTLAICNMGVSTLFRVAVRPAGEVLADKHYIVYDNYVNQYDTVFLTLGVTLASTDVVTVYSAAATVSFSLFGSEVV